MANYTTKIPSLKNSDRIRRTPAGAIDTDHHRKIGARMRSEAFHTCLLNFHRRIEKSLTKIRNVGEIGTVLQMDDSAKV